MGASSPEVEIYDSYFTGQITCVRSSTLDGCGGLTASIFSGTLTIERSYSTAQIIATSRNRSTGVELDKVGLVLGSSGALTLNPADVAISDEVYFIRDRIGLQGPDRAFDNMNPYIQSASQPCADIVVSTLMSNNACPNLLINNTTTNRGLTRGQMQTAPSSSTNNGNSPAALGGEFLYTNGWCPRVCRHGASPCSETSLVGFDASGQPLAGPGGGLIAQANNEGNSCFDVEPIGRNDVPDAPPAPSAPPPTPPLRACTITGNFSANFSGVGASVSSAHSSPSDPSANDTLSVRINTEMEQTGVAATVTGTAASLNVTSAVISAGTFAGNAVTVTIQITALNVSNTGIVCMDESTTEIGVDIIVSGSTNATVPNGTYTGGNTNGTTRDGCTLNITQAGGVSGSTVEAELLNCIIVGSASTSTPASLISVKFLLEIP